VVLISGDHRTLVKQNGTSLTQEIGNSGVYATGSIDGGTKTVQVLKCKSCGELLSEANLVRSSDEVIAEEKKQKRLSEDRTGWHWFYGIIAVCVVLTLFLISG